MIGHLGSAPMRTANGIIEDIKAHPDQHRHNADDLFKCCFIDGALDLSVMDAHSQFVDLGSNGGIKCDVVSGPCSCGAWH